MPRALGDKPVSLETKCEAVATGECDFTLYGESLRLTDRFVYLGVPFRVNGIDANQIVQKNIASTVSASEGIAALGVNAYGCHRHRAILAWQSFVRSCLEFGNYLVDK